MEAGPKQARSDSLGRLRKTGFPRPTECVVVMRLTGRRDTVAAFTE